MINSSGIKDHPVVSHEEWLSARTAFLAKEKAFTRLRDELSQQRRALPWEKVDKQYVFDGPKEYGQVYITTTGGIMTNRNDYNRQVIEEFRANGGKVSGPWEHTPLLLLTTTGARSGERRMTPMGYIPDGDCLIVIASNGGAPTRPDWYHNLVAHPEVTVEVGTETFDAIAVVTEDSERDRLWTKAVELYPHLAEYQAKTTRQIPVIALSLTQHSAPLGSDRK